MSIGVPYSSHREDHWSRGMQSLQRNRKIVILPTEDVESEDVPKELLDICADLGIPREKVNIVLRMTEEENGKKQILSDAKEGAKLSK